MLCWGERRVAIERPCGRSKMCWGAWGDGLDGDGSWLLRYLVRVRLFISDSPDRGGSAHGSFRFRFWQNRGPAPRRPGARHPREEDSKVKLRETT